MAGVTARWRAVACAAALATLFAGCSSARPSPTPTPDDAATLAAERATGALNSRALGVPPFGVSGADERLASLSYALADIITTDLARSGQLTLVERTRLNDVLRELDLTASGRVDSATAPRVGRLVSARRLVIGSLDQLGEGSLRLGVRLADVERGTVEQAIDAQAPLVDILDAEKALVFKIFDALGVTLTPEERALVAQRPTDDLAALLAYGDGVRAEYLGDYRAAASAYRRANRIDAAFGTAARRAQQVRARSETGTTAPLALPGLRSRDAAVGGALDRINQPLAQVAKPIRNTGGAGDPSFPTTAATVLITITRP